MAYDGKIMARARARLADQREENQAERQRRLQQVYRRVPEIERMDAEMRQHMARLVRLTVSRAPDIKEQAEALKEENLELQVRRAELLVENGWPLDYLDEIVSCPKCRDSGTLEGRPCSCLERLYNLELTRELGVLMQNGDESFERFDLSLYSEQPDAKLGLSPRETMGMVYTSCKKFADDFSPASSPNLLLQGDPGLGKTYLSACIARVVAAKGFSVCYDTAASALDAFERQKFSRDPVVLEEVSAKVRRMLSCDLMILDDLGTEMITPISVSALYTLLNTRLVNGKKLIISTNLSDGELAQKYSSQICSRIAGEFIHLPFVGKDIRLIKKGL